MGSYKEIVTKTVIGKGKKSFKNSVSIVPDEKPNTVLGCWVINHTFTGENNKGMVVVNGSYDINVSYSYDLDHKTAVATKRYNYSEKLNVPIKTNGMLSENSEIIVHSLMQPNVIDVKIEGNTVVLNVEKELGVEIVGEDKIKVSIEDNEDDYVEIYDEDDLDQVIEQVDENYLNNVNQN